jgi:hypothetical protein
MVKEGDSIQLSVNIQPANIAGGNVTWISTNENIAQVDESGLVMTKTAGDCDIIATYFNVYDTAHITVIDPADISITIDTPDFSSCLANTSSISVTTYPIPTELKATSSDTTVAVVRVEDNIVKIQGKSIGYTDVVIGSQDGISLSDTCQVCIFTTVGDADANGKTTTDYKSEGVVQRISDSLYNNLKTMKSYAGTSTETSDGSTLGNLIRELQTKMSNLKTMMKSYENLLYKKYDAMETAIQRLSVSMGYITGGQ